METETKIMCERIKERLDQSAPECLRHNAKEAEIIRAMWEAKTLGDRTFDRLDAEFGCSPGLYFAIKAIIKDLRAGQRVNPRSAAAARADRVLRVRDSNGRATPRRFN